MARSGDDRWSKAVFLWRPSTYKKNVGYLTARWVDDIVVIAGRPWIGLAQERGAGTIKVRLVPSSGHNRTVDELSLKQSLLYLIKTYLKLFSHFQRTITREISQR